MSGIKFQPSSARVLKITLLAGFIEVIADLSVILYLLEQIQLLRLIW